MSKRNTRVYRPDVDCPCNTAYRWHVTLAAKARRASQGPRGQRWVYRALANLLCQRHDDALLLGEYPALERDLLALSGTPMVQSL